MTIEAVLVAEAKQIARDLQTSSLSMKEELLRIETRAEEIKIALDAAKEAEHRLVDFNARLGVHYQCPRCWINYETRSPLVPGQHR